jgi:hypothetical protein
VIARFSKGRELRVTSGDSVRRTRSITRCSLLTTRNFFSAIKKRAVGAALCQHS